MITAAALRSSARFTTSRGWTLALSMVPQPGFGSVMLHYLTTVLAYPLVVFVCYYILRVQKITPDQAIRFGYRL